MEEGEKKSVIAQVGSWLWGTIEGGFNEKQTTSQLVVDAAVSMIPLLGDATAARDLIAVILRLVREPERRKDKLEWVQLVILVFALIPVVGGAIKGIGKIIFQEGSRAAELLPKVIQALNRVGFGDAVTFVKSLELTQYEAMLRGKFAELADRLDVVVDAVLRRLSFAMPGGMIAFLQRLKSGINDLRALADRKIPDALKEFQRRLKLIQSQIYDGAWHEVATSTRTTTREAEARLVETETTREWKVEYPHHPPNSESDFHPARGWPDLLRCDDAAEVIAGFSGPMRAVRLKPGERIFRVIEGKRGNAGRWWARKLPENGVRWREDYAVLDRFNKNHYYVEFTVPEQGLWVWEGTVASQIDRRAVGETAGQYLAGGETQLFLDLRFERNSYALKAVQDLSPQETHWSEYMGLHVPEKGVEVQPLGEHELEPKKYSTPARAGAAARATRSGDQQEASP